MDDCVLVKRTLLQRLFQQEFRALGTRSTIINYGKESQRCALQAGTTCNDAIINKIKQFNSFTISLCLLAAHLALLSNLH